jgi:ABC-type transport system involved in Fe-S cluster assembly fused permease/ATPase subunit
VDSQTELALSRALSAARRGCTTIAIAHRLSTIVDADENPAALPRVGERGTHGELMALGA